MRTKNIKNYWVTGISTVILFVLSMVNVIGQSTVMSSSGSGITAATDETIYTVYVPNSFTPNSDGVNDQFMVYSEQLKRINLKVYDQQGQEVYNTSEIGQGWDGKHHDREMHQDTYLYRIEAEYVNGYSETLVGPLNLIR
jgi:gliding motility-associated-like protein